MGEGEKAIAYGANGFLTKPYARTGLLYAVRNAVALQENTFIANIVWRDALTGLLTRESFFFEAQRVIHCHEPGYYVLSCLDIENFKTVNAQYGAETGDEALKYVAGAINDLVAETGGLVCRFHADRFALLYPAQHGDSSLTRAYHKKVMQPQCIDRQIRIRVGTYLADDLSAGKTCPADGGY